MGSSAFADRSAKAEVAAAIREIEGATSAEIVVAVRPSSGRYRETDYLFGFVVSLVALLVFLFDEHEFSIDWMPLDSLLAFFLGTAASATISPLRRALTARSRMQENVERAARNAFFDLGISKTKGRTGILVYASMFERTVEIVTDVGIDRVVLGPAFESARAALDTAIRKGPDFTGFIAQLRSLGPILGKAFPRSADDVNELPDEPIS